MIDLIYACQFSRIRSAVELIGAGSKSIQTGEGVPAFRWTGSPSARLTTLIMEQLLLARSVDTHCNGASQHWLAGYGEEDPQTCTGVGPIRAVTVGPNHSITLMPQMTRCPLHSLRQLLACER
jgi:hypothetical protein